MIADNPRRTATAGESLDRMISLAQEMLRNRHWRSVDKAVRT